MDDTMSMTTDTAAKATPGSRLIAAIIDGLVIAVVSWLAGLVLQNSTTGGLVGFLVGLVYYVYFWTKTGATPGKQAMGIKVVRTDGSLLTPGGAVVRFIGYYISGFVLLLGYLWILIDAERQGWHDKIAGTYVVQAK